MKFNLQTPCKDCPFIKGSSTNQTLPKSRISGIVTDVRNGASFICHKTLELSSKDQQHCAGAMVFLEKENNPNQMMRIAERIGCYNRKKLNMNVDIIDS